MFAFSKQKYLEVQKLVLMS